jgi:hypothetical protein
METQPINSLKLSTLNIISNIRHALLYEFDVRAMLKFFKLILTLPRSAKETMVAPIVWF